MESFARTDTPAGSTDHDQTMFLDETAGSLGEGAAVLSAILAGLDEPNRRHVARFGRGLSIARQITRILDADLSEAMVVPPRFDEAQLRTLTERRRADATQALNILSETVDVTRLRAFAEIDEPLQDRTNSATDDDILN